MNDMSMTIVAKSDQINAADLIGNPRTITVREVRIKAGEDQPVSILIEGDQKAFRPCKGVRRLLVHVWGTDASKYIGQSMTLFCDPGVTWAGKEEGGIRVSHMTGLSKKITFAMRVNRAGTKPYEIKPLANERHQDAQKSDVELWCDKFIARANACTTDADLNALVSREMKWLDKLSDTLRADCDAAVSSRLVELIPSDGRTDEQHGDQFPD